MEAACDAEVKAGSGLTIREERRGQPVSKEPEKQESVNGSGGEAQGRGQPGKIGG